MKNTKTNNIQELNESSSKENFSEEVKASLKKANDYFDKNPPKANTEEELNNFFKQ